MIFHAVDFAAVNSWFEYRKECEKLNIPKNDQLSFLDFKMRLAEGLIKSGKPVGNNKRGRPSSASPMPRKKQRVGLEESRPIAETWYDSIDHLPQLDGAKEGKRCKYPNCN